MENKSFAIGCFIVGILAFIVLMSAWFGILDDLKDATLEISYCKEDCAKVGMDYHFVGRDGDCYCKDIDGRIKELGGAT